MNLDPKTAVIAKISAAMACNAMASLRVAITEGLEMGIPASEIQEVLALASEIQQQPISHVSHLADQLLRTPAIQSPKPERPSTEHKHKHEHGHGHAHDCGCGCHHS